MIHDKRQFTIGLVLLAGFLGALALVFRPLENGQNTLDYLDGVFNSTSKASAYYIPAARAKAERLGAEPISVEVRGRTAEQAALVETLLRASGATVARQGVTLSVSGDLRAVLAAALADADAMFRNDGARVAAKYGGLDARRVLYAWHTALGDAAKALDRQSRFRDAAAVRDAMTKGLEPAYNYYGVTAIAMKDMIWIALAALVGYVLYTVWYGYAILFLFEGWGVKLGH